MAFQLIRGSRYTATHCNTYFPSEIVQMNLNNGVHTELVCDSRFESFHSECYPPDIQQNIKFGFHCISQIKIKLIQFEFGLMKSLKRVFRFGE